MTTDVLEYLSDSGVPVSRKTSAGLSQSAINAIAMQAGEKPNVYGAGADMQSHGEGSEYGTRE